MNYELSNTFFNRQVFIKYNCLQIKITDYRAVDKCRDSFNTKVKSNLLITYLATSAPG